MTQPLELVTPPVIAAEDEVSFGPVLSLGEHGEKLRSEFEADA